MNGHGGNTPRRRCPVCYRRVMPTRGGLIYGHWDSLGRDRCPASWHSYEITVVGDRKPITPLELVRAVTHHGYTELVAV